MWKNWIWQSICAVPMKDSCVQCEDGEELRIRWLTKLHWRFHILTAFQQWLLDNWNWILHPKISIASVIVCQTQGGGGKKEAYTKQKFFYVLFWIRYWGVVGIEWNRMGKPFKCWIMCIFSSFRTVVIIHLPCLVHNGKNFGQIFVSSLACWFDSVSIASFTMNTWWIQSSLFWLVCQIPKFELSGIPVHSLVSKLAQRPGFSKQLLLYLTALGFTFRGNGTEFGQHWVFLRILCKLYHNWFNYTKNISGLAYSLGNCAWMRPEVAKDHENSTPFLPMLRNESFPPNPSTISPSLLSPPTLTTPIFCFCCPGSKGSSCAAPE